MNALHGKGTLFQGHQPELVTVAKVRRRLARPEDLGLARRVGGVEHILARNDLLAIHFSIYTPIIRQQQTQPGPVAQAGIKSAIRLLLAICAYTPIGVMFSTQWLPEPRLRQLAHIFTCGGGQDSAQHVGLGAGIDKLLPRWRVSVCDGAQHL